MKSKRNDNIKKQLKEEERLYYFEVCMRIKLAREVRKIKQETVAKKIGMSRTNYVNLENYNLRPSIFQIYKIAEVLEIGMNRLIPKQIKLK